MGQFGNNMDDNNFMKWLSFDFWHVLVELVFVRLCLLPEIDLHHFIDEFGTCKLIFEE